MVERCEIGMHQKFSVAVATRLAPCMRIEPQTAMPETGVTERDGRDIAAYLYTLRDAPFSARRLRR